MRFDTLQTRERPRRLKRRRSIDPGYAAILGPNSRYKAVNRHCEGRPEPDDDLAIYDLDADPFETSDVAADHPDIVAAFRAALAAPDLTCRCYQC